MSHRFLAIIDKTLEKLSKIAKICRRANKKALGIFATLIFSCSIVALLGEEELNSFPIIKRAYYDTIVSHIPRFVDFISAPIGKWVFALLSIAVIIFLLLRWFCKPLALLISHSTLGHDITIIEKGLQNAFWFKRLNIKHDLPAHDASTLEIVSAIKQQDSILPVILKNCWRSNVFYYGVAHTPLIFRLGYQIGQTRSIHFLHRFRPTEDTQEFKRLPENDNDKESFLVNSEVMREESNNCCNQLLVSIASTYPIKQIDLLTIDPSNTMFRYDVQVDRMGYDFFSSHRKIHAYADRIVEDIRNIIKEHQIETIHLVISSSVPFTLYLGQQMNTQQFCKIIVYHYDSGRYTWGINVKEKDAHKAVVWAQTCANDCSK